MTMHASEVYILKSHILFKTEQLNINKEIYIKLDSIKEIEIDYMDHKIYIDGILIPSELFDKTVTCLKEYLDKN